MTDTSRLDRIERAALAWFTFTTVIFWLPTIRGAFDGPSYEWGLFGMGGKGLAGDYWFPVVSACVALLVMAGGWRGMRWAFAAMVVWNLGLLATTIAVVSSNPDDFRLRGDTLGIDISLAWAGPALFGAAVFLSVIAARRVFRAPPVVVAWSSRSVWWLKVLAAALPVQFVLLRFGSAGSLSDQVGVVITIAQWFLIGRVFRPYVG